MPNSHHSPAKNILQTAKPSKNGVDISMEPTLPMPEVLPHQPPPVVPMIPPVVAQPAKPMKILAPEIQHYSYAYNAPPPMGYPPAFSTPIPQVVSTSSGILF